VPDRFERVEATDLKAIDAPPAAAQPGEDGLPLPGGVRERLRARVGTAADRIRVHDDATAHALAQAQGADAVAVGTAVYFARGRYQPHDLEGFALLAHEAVHVEHATRPGAAWQRGGAPALADEEVSARAVERDLLGGTLRAPPPAAVAIAAPAAAALPVTPAVAAPASGQPMRAASDRALPAPLAAPAMDMEALRQSLMRDLMGQIRADMERGG
jgi:hypothetical protein